MSRNIRFRANLNPIRLSSQLLLQSKLVGCNVPELTCSSELRERVEALADAHALGEPERVAAAYGALAALPGVSDVLATRDAALEPLLVRSSSASELSEYNTRIINTGRQLADDLAAAERHATFQAASSALEQAGWTIRTAEDEHRSAIHAQLEGRDVAIVVTAGGSVEADVAGCAGGECSPVVEQLVADLADRGIEMQVVASDVHDEPRGGALIQRAARAARRGGARGHLELGLLWQSEQEPRERRPTRTPAADRITIGRPR